MIKAVVREFKKETCKGCIEEIPEAKGKVASEAKDIVLGAVDDLADRRLGKESAEGGELFGGEGQRIEEDDALLGGDLDQTDPGVVGGELIAFRIDRDRRRGGEEVKERRKFIGLIDPLQARVLQRQKKRAKGARRVGVASRLGQNQDFLARQEERTGSRRQGVVREEGERETPEESGKENPTREEGRLRER